MVEYKYDLSLVIACYNETGHLAKNIGRITDTLNRSGYSYELIFINDASPDDTAKIIKEICAGHDNYRFIDHKLNVGRGGTVREGLLIADGKYAGFLDVDLEVDAHYIPRALKKLDEGYDAVIGHRYYDLFAGYGITRAILSICYRFIVKIILNLNIKDTESGFKFFNISRTKDVIEKTKNNYWFWDTEIVFELVYARKIIFELPCLFIRNNEIKTSVKFFRDINRYVFSLVCFKIKKGFFKNKFN